MTDRNDNWQPRLIREALLPNAGAVWGHTGSAGSYVDHATWTIPGKLVNLGYLIITPVWFTTTINANSKQVRIRLAGNDVFLPASSAMSGFGAYRPNPIVIRNTAYNAQEFPPKTMSGTTSGSGVATLAVDMSADQDLVFAANLGTGSDDIRLGYETLVEIIHV